MGVSIRSLNRKTRRSVAAKLRKVVEHEILVISIDDLTIDQKYQRRLDERRTQRIVEAFESNAVRVLVVSIRQNGTIVVLDGQHRLEVLKREGFTHVQCEVRRGLTMREESRLFDLLNFAKSVSPAVKVMGAYNTGDILAKKLVNAIRGEGFFTIQFLRKEDKDKIPLGSVGMLKEIFQTSPSVFAGTLSVLKKVYGNEPRFPIDARGSAFIHGLFNFMREDNVSCERMVEVLCKAKNNGFGAREIREKVGQGSGGWKARDAFKVEFRMIFSRGGN